MLLLNFYRFKGICRKSGIFSSVVLENRIAKILAHISEPMRIPLVTVSIIQLE